MAPAVETSPNLWGSLSFDSTRCGTEGLQISYWHNGHFLLFLSKVFQGNRSPIPSAGRGASVGRVLGCSGCHHALSDYFGWILGHPSGIFLLFEFYCWLIFFFFLFFFHSVLNVLAKWCMCIYALCHFSLEKKVSNDTNTGDVNENH